MQTALVLIVVALAVAYALRRVRSSLKHGSSGCSGCKLADTCSKHKKRKHAC